MAAIYNFEIEQGTTFTKSFVWKDSAKQVVLMSGYTARMQIRPSVKAPEILLNLTTENGRIIIIPTEGKITLLIDARTTADITWSKGRYDLELVSPDYTVTRLLQGDISISKEVTR